MMNKLTGKIKDHKKVLSLPASIGESHVGLRHHLGDGVFLCENGDLSICYPIQGITDEIMTETELTEAFTPISKFVQAIIKGIPSYKDNASTVVQIICSQRTTSNYPAPSGELPENDAGALIQAEERHLFSTELITRSFYLTIRWQRPKIFNLKEELKRVLNSAIFHKSQWLEALSADKNLFLRELKNKLIESGLKLNPLTSREVIAYYNNVLNQSKSVPYDLDDDETSFICQKIITSKIIGSPKGFETDGGENTRVFTFLELPYYFALGRMRLFLDHLPCKNFDFTWVASHGAKATSTDFLLKKMFFSQGPSHQKKYADLLSFEDDIDAQNPMLRMSCRLLVHNINENTESQILSAGVDFLNAPTICEEEIAPHLIATSLPMNCSKEDHDIIGRYKTVLLDRSLMFTPLYTSPTNEQAVRHWISRSGETIKIDIFGSGGNNHLVILGNSESGKSCLLSQFNIEFLWRFEDGVIRVVDRKTSYRKVCDLFGGKIIQFNESYLREHPYSPFANKEWDEDDVQNIVVFLGNAILQLNPEAVLTGLHTEILGEAIKLAANDHERNHEYAEKSGDSVDPHPTWIDISKKLPIAAGNKGSGKDLVQEALEDIRRWTVSFNTTGQFGFLFCSHEDHNRSTEDARMVVYDLDGIADPRLQVIASQLAFLKISRDLKRLDRKTRKLIVFEELGVMVAGDSPHAGEIATRFVRNAVKTARKIGAQCIGVSNELDDFTETAGGKTFFKVSPQRLFLPQSSATKAEIEEKLAKELSSADIDIIKSLHIKKGHYSQGYLVSENTRYKGSFLIPLSPVMNAIVTTTASEEFYYDSLRKNGLGVREALEDMAKNHPYGDGL
ncbi:MAG: hypothetical protein H6618_08850 [Deltaproteobacteria bacterium]|nr:hypothetical protein [Deltaproteobacteria bacterium]